MVGAGRRRGESLGRADSSWLQLLLSATIGLRHLTGEVYDLLPPCHPTDILPTNAGIGIVRRADSAEDQRGVSSQFRVADGRQSREGNCLAAQIGRVRSDIRGAKRRGECATSGQGSSEAWDGSLAATPDFSTVSKLRVPQQISLSRAIWI